MDSNPHIAPPGGGTPKPQSGIATEVQPSQEVPEPGTGRAGTKEVTFATSPTTSKTETYSSTVVTGYDGKVYSDSCAGSCQASVSAPGQEGRPAFTADASGGQPGSGAPPKQQIAVSDRSVSNTGAGSTVTLGEDGVLTGNCGGGGACDNAGTAGPTSLQTSGQSTMTVGMQNDISVDCRGDCSSTGANPVGPASAELIGGGKVKLSETHLETNPTASTTKQESKLGDRTAMVDGGAGGTRIDGTQAVADCEGCAGAKVDNVRTGVGAWASAAGGTLSKGTARVETDTAYVDQWCKGGNCRAEAYDASGTVARGGCIGGECSLNGSVGPGGARFQQSGKDNAGFDRSVTVNGTTLPGGGANAAQHTGVTSIDPKGQLSYQVYSPKLGPDGKPVAGAHFQQPVVRDGRLTTQTTVSTDGQPWGGGVSRAPDGTTIDWQTPAEMLKPGGQIQEGVDKGLDVASRKINNDGLMAAVIPGYIAANGTNTPNPASSVVAAEAINLDSQIAAGVAAKMGAIVTGNEQGRQAVATLAELDPNQNAAMRDAIAAAESGDLSDEQAAMLDRWNAAVDVLNVQAGSYQSVLDQSTGRLEAADGSVIKSLENGTPEEQGWLNNHRNDLPSSGNSLVSNALRSAAVTREWDGYQGPFARLLNETNDAAAPQDRDYIAGLRSGFTTPREWAGEFGRNNPGLASTPEEIGVGARTVEELKARLPDNVESKTLLDSMRANPNLTDLPAAERDRFMAELARDAASRGQWGNAGDGIIDIVDSWAEAKERLRDMVSVRVHLDNLGNLGQGFGKAASTELGHLWNWSSEERPPSATDRPQMPTEWKNHPVQFNADLARNLGGMVPHVAGALVRNTYYVAEDTFNLVQSARKWDWQYADRWHSKPGEDTWGKIVRNEPFGGGMIEGVRRTGVNFINNDVRSGKQGFFEGNPFQWAGNSPEYRQSPADAMANDIGTALIVAGPLKGVKGGKGAAGAAKSASIPVKVTAATGRYVATAAKMGLGLVILPARIVAAPIGKALHISAKAPRAAAVAAQKRATSVENVGRPAPGVARATAAGLNRVASVTQALADRTGKFAKPVNSFAAGLGRAAVGAGRGISRAGGHGVDFVRGLADRGPRATGKARPGLPEGAPQARFVAGRYGITDRAAARFEVARDGTVIDRAVKPVETAPGARPLPANGTASSPNDGAAPRRGAPPGNDVPVSSGIQANDGVPSPTGNGRPSTGDGTPAPGSSPHGADLNQPVANAGEPRGVSGVREAAGLLGRAAELARHGELGQARALASQAIGQLLSATSSFFGRFTAADGFAATNETTGSTLAGTRAGRGARAAPDARVNDRSGDPVDPAKRANAPDPAPSPADPFHRGDNQNVAPAPAPAQIATKVGRGKRGKGDGPPGPPPKKVDGEHVGAAADGSIVDNNAKVHDPAQDHLAHGPPSANGRPTDSSRQDAGTATTNGKANHTKDPETPDTKASDRNDCAACAARTADSRNGQTSTAPPEQVRPGQSGEDVVTALEGRYGKQAQTTTSTELETGARNGTIPPGTHGIVWTGGERGHMFNFRVDGHGRVHYSDSLGKLGRNDPHVRDIEGVLQADRGAPVKIGERPTSFPDEFGSRKNNKRNAGPGTVAAGEKFSGRKPSAGTKKNTSDQAVIADSVPRVSEQTTAAERPGSGAPPRQRAPQDTQARSPPPDTNPGAELKQRFDELTKRLDAVIDQRQKVESGRLTREREAAQRGVDAAEARLNELYQRRADGLAEQVRAAEHELAERAATLDARKIAERDAIERANEKDRPALPSKESPRATELIKKRDAAQQPFDQAKKAVEAQEKVVDALYRERKKADPAKRSAIDERTRTADVELTRLKKDADSAQKALKAAQHDLVKLRALRRYQDDINKVRKLWSKLDEAGYQRLLQRGRANELTDVEQYVLVAERIRRSDHKTLYDVQLAAEMALGRGPVRGRLMFLVMRGRLPRGTVVEMLTGEGKTVVGALSAFRHVLKVRAKHGGDVPGKGVHVITHNSTLARKGFELYDRVGTPLRIEQGFLKPDSGARIGVGERELDGQVGRLTSDLAPELRRLHYEAPITHGSLHEFGFDSLRDARVPAEQRVQTGHDYVIGDEFDMLSHDLGRSPMILAEPINGLAGRADAWNWAVDAARHVKPDDFRIGRRGQVRIDDLQAQRIAQRLGQDKLTTQQRLDLAELLEAPGRLRRNQAYFVDGEVVIVDNNIGYAQPGHRWNRHQAAVEALEGLPVRPPQQIVARTTSAEYFGRYDRASGMTGTATRELSVFGHRFRTPIRGLGRHYRMRVERIPTHKPRRLERWDDEIIGDGAHIATIVDDAAAHRAGASRPVQHFSNTIEQSEHLASKLADRGASPDVLNALPPRVAREQEYNASIGREGAVSSATNIAGRGNDPPLGGDREYFRNESKEALDAERKRVIKAGGMHVVIATLSESRRSLDQAFGRAGRNGEPGSGQLRISAKDEVLQRFLRPSELARLEKALSDNGSRLSGKEASEFIGRALDRAEKAASRELNRTIRGKDTDGAVVREAPARSAEPTARERELNAAVARVDTALEQVRAAREDFVRDSGLRTGKVTSGLASASAGLSRTQAGLDTALGDYRVLINGSADAQAVESVGAQENSSVDAQTPVSGGENRPTELTVTKETVRQARELAAAGDLAGAAKLLGVLGRDAMVTALFAADGWGAAEWTAVEAQQTVATLLRLAAARQVDNGTAGLTGAFDRLAALVATLPEDTLAAAGAMLANLRARQAAKSQRGSPAEDAPRPAGRLRQRAVGGADPRPAGRRLGAARDGATPPGECAGPGERGAARPAEHAPRPPGSRAQPTDQRA